MKQRFLILLIALLGAQILVAQSVTINKGAGSFKINGSSNHQADSITIFYHKPENFTRSSEILLVVSGAGRNGDDYRDSWIETSEKYGVLIISPSYPEKEYNYGDYHLGGIVKDLNLSKGVSFKKGTNQVHINENMIEFNINKNKEDWIFNDFDRIFKLVKKATKSKQRKYDMFGHSAGGQILHRFALFYPNSKANRILASNAGTYTFPDFNTNFPFGIMNVGIQKKQLKKSFKTKLVLFLGELDNDSETRGRMFRSETADKQGTNRFDRGNNFYKFSEELSKKHGMKFNWKLELVTNVGHDQKKMAEAAAEYLYRK
ncbi:hypothetical protein FBALC1_08873 [Flavobacteriales bacterium ALC-1]|nr:hypothetical protein FBALC1_08873 [Flavobacteriales bacterium ALC-1]